MGCEGKKTSNLSHFFQTKTPTSNAFKVFLLTPKKPDIHFQSPKNTIIFMFHKKNQKNNNIQHSAKQKKGEFIIRPPKKTKTDPNRPECDATVVSIFFASRASTLLPVSSSFTVVSLCRVVSLVGDFFFHTQR